MIKKIYIQKYKVFKQFDLELNDTLNILVGDNEVGKSTILEAINLALTKRFNGRFIEYELTPYIFNRESAEEYWASVKGGKAEPLPEIKIELYLNDSEELESLRGSMNTKKEDCIGVKLEIVFDEDYKKEYENLIKNHKAEKAPLIPAEYYKVQWYSFANNAITLRSLPIRLSFIDATTIRLQSGTDYYLQDIIKTDLDVKERVELSVSYRQLKEMFQLFKADGNIYNHSQSGNTEILVTIGTRESKQRLLRKIYNDSIIHLDRKYNRAMEILK